MDVLATRAKPTLPPLKYYARLFHDSKIRGLHYLFKTKITV